jgi:DNA-binding HxlR family transcriptional regulator
MFRYGQFCPISKAVEVIGERWAVLVLRELLLGHTQFNQLQHALPRISPTTLTKRLAELQASGLIIRKRAPGQLGHQYQVTASARELWPVLVSVGKWGMRWARGRMRNDELDVGMLMGDVQRRIDARLLPRGLSILHFKFTDLTEYADWWVKIDGKETDLCLDDPGFEVDVYFTTDLRTLTEVWMGDLPLERARASGKLKIVGRSAYLKNLKSWLRLHSMASIRPAMRI